MCVRYDKKFGTCELDHGSVYIIGHNFCTIRGTWGRATIFMFTSEGGVCQLIVSRSVCMSLSLKHLQLIIQEYVAKQLLQTL